MDFDLYAKTISDLSVGSVVSLDGIDGFFDQHFEGAKPGDLIRFVICPRGPAGIPASGQQLRDLDFVEARIRTADSTGADVEILSCVKFGEWLDGLIGLAAITTATLEAKAAGAPIRKLLRKASATGEASWRFNERFRSTNALYWRDSSQTSAVYIDRQPFGLRVVVLYTNAVSAFVASVSD